MTSFKLYLFFSFLFFFLQPSKGYEICRTRCGPVPIRFPFQIISSLPENRCGYPGFTVLCENETQNILTFPSGEFRIESIDYLWQLISISDPSNCTAKRLLQGFDYLNTPFQPLYARNFTFLNCTSDPLIFLSTGVSPIPCLSSESYSVVALPNDRYNVSNILSCSEIATFLYPSLRADDSSDSW
ncbi:putative RING-H2 finger protein ATL21A [Durio zibethinus]|uniref:RING-type E3 ubiquitin transferase n=1 Tax=Durio zibethinus TaxID=66656 RepID=A0A6P6A8T5_DURZI|nr:putative RING-H2 finger protein ATL21A [Durio zibethinus]